MLMFKANENLPAEEGRIVRMGEDDDPFARRSRKESSSNGTDLLIVGVCALVVGVIWGYASNVDSYALEPSGTYAGGFNDAKDIAEEYGAPALKKVAVIANASMASGQTKSPVNAVTAALGDVVKMGGSNVIDISSTKAAA